MAVSEDAHSSITNTLRILEMDPLVVRSDDHRLTGAGLRAALAADGDPGSVAAVVATSGTTNAGIIDDLAGVAAVAREHQLWFHVDGAYGGAGLFAPSVRDRYAGIEHADSFIVDPHKWLFAPFDCAALLYRNPSVARSVHKQDASYLDVIHDRPGEWNPTDYAYHLTRRARGLPLWFSLSVYGVDAYSEAIETAIELARQTADEIRASAHLELVREPSLGSGAVPPPRLGRRAVHRVGRPAAAGPGGVHSAVGVGGRDGGEVRVPAPAHLDGPGARDPRPDGLTGSLAGLRPRRATATPGGPAAGARPAARRRRDCLRSVVRGLLVLGEFQLQVQVRGAHGTFL